MKVYKIIITTNIKKNEIQVLKKLKQAITKIFKQPGNILNNTKLVEVEEKLIK